MKKVNKKIILLITILIMSISIITTFAAGKFNPKIVSISNANNNGTMAKEISKTFDNKSIDLGVLFQMPNDELTYEIVLENEGSKSGTLSDINIISNNDNVTYKVVGLEKNDKLEANSKVTFKLVAKAKSSNLIKGKDTVKISLIYIDEDGNIVTPSNPNTFDGIMKYIIILIISIVGILIALNKKNKTIEIITLLITIGTISVKASTGTILITMNVDIDPITTWDGQVATTCFDKGAGTETDPYQIKNGEQLACFAKSVNEGNNYEGEYVELTKDIALNSKVLDGTELINENSLNEWTPIGIQDSNTYEFNTFNGNFNGNNKSISGIYIKNDPTKPSYNGLFGCTQNAKISNLQINDSYVEGNQMTTILSAYNTAGIQIDNVETNGLIKSDGSFAGGLVGMVNGAPMHKTIIKNSTNNATIESNSQMTAGIIAYNTGPELEITNTKNTGNISKNENSYITSAGIIARTSTQTVKVENSYNTGNINGGNNSAGLIGEISAPNIIIKDSYNRGNVDVDGSFGAGIVSIIGTGPNDQITLDKVHNTGNIYSSNGYSGGLVSQSRGAITIINSYNTGKVETPSESSYSGGIIAAVTNSSIIENCYNKGEIKGGYAVSGILGAGLSREGLEIKNCYNAGRINYGIERSMTTENTGIMYIGGVLGYAITGTVENCYNTGDIYALQYSGGVAGSFQGTITNTYNAGMVEGYIYIGGIVGTGNEINKSYNKGLIKSYEEYDTNNSCMHIGGISGKSTTIEDSYNVGEFEVSGVFIGGISGESDVANSYNVSDIIVTNETENNLLNYNISGITGMGNVENSYNAGNISITVDEAMTIFASGISSVYNNHTIKNNCNTGNIEIKYAQNTQNVSAAGISYIGNSESTNNFTSGRITLDPRYSLEYDSNNEIFAGAVFAQYSGNTDVQLTNKYVKYDDLFTNYAVGTSRYNLDELGTNKINDVNIGTKTTEEAPSILSIINKNNSFKPDANNINNGYPILK